jgi:hypothetical protein
VANPGGDWQHDVYYAWIADPVSSLEIEPRILVARPEAQEPPSTAINSRGTILMTTEDGDGEINQRAALWDAQLNVLRKYPFTIRRGGHSGHVAAMGERFLVVYGEGWVEHGGFLGRGTGQDVYARIVEADGMRRTEVKLASGHRDGWPLVAASERNWLVLWQRYPELTLHSAVIDGEGHVHNVRTVTGGMPVRYTYGVEYSRELACYVVTGASDGEGFIAYVNLAGDLIKMQRGLPLPVSESRLVLGLRGNAVVGAYPVAPRGVAIVRLAADAIALGTVIAHDYEWDYGGTTGVFVSPHKVVFATLSTKGIKLIPVELGD